MKTERHNCRPDVLLIGASVRAAAFSALRAGFTPWTADLYGDADLRAFCPGIIVQRKPSDADADNGGLSAGGRTCTTGYPDALADALQKFDANIPCAYTGGLENHPEVVARLKTQRPLWGNAPDVLRAVRNPFRVAAALAESGVPTPALQWTVAGLPADGSWLQKPLQGAGGSGIESWRGQLRNRRRPGFYYQQRIAGQPIAAVFVGDGLRADFLGATRQLVGESWLHARPFHYCGSVGPLALDQTIEEQLRLLGNVLAGCFQLRGLFGVDAVLQDTRVWCIEVNPRYPASVEVLEHALGISAFAAHARAFGASTPTLRPGDTPGRNRSAILGKAVLFARAGLRVPESVPKPMDARRGREICGFTDAAFTPPAFADLPHPGEFIRAGAPILTLFVGAATETDCMMELQRTACDLDRRLYAG